MCCFGCFDYWKLLPPPRALKCVILLLSIHESRDRIVLSMVVVVVVCECDCFFFFFGFVGSIIRFCYLHSSRCFFYVLALKAYCSIIIICFQLLLNIVCNACVKCMREKVFFGLLLHFLYCFITIIFFFPSSSILPLNYFTKFRVYIVEPNIMLNTIN